MAKGLPLSMNLRVKIKLQNPNFRENSTLKHQVGGSALARVTSLVARILRVGL
jgi:hypothetical protein